MPKNFPRAPPPVLAATLAPCAWAWGAPDLFDSYSAGVILMQVGRPTAAGSASQGCTGLCVCDALQSGRGPGCGDGSAKARMCGAWVCVG